MLSNMATTTDLAVSPSVSVIGPQFISPNPLEIKIEKYSLGTLVVTDSNNKIILKVKPCNSTAHRQLWILDDNDRPILKLREKNWSARKRWNVFRGESKDIIFTTRKNSMVQFKMCVNVYLGNKKSCNNDYDFQIKGNWSKKSCSIHMGDSKTPISQLDTVQPLENMKMEKSNLMVVTINPNVDYAFVVALIAIVDAMNSSEKEVAKTVKAKGAEGMINCMCEMLCGCE